MSDTIFDSHDWPGLFIDQDPSQGRRIILPAELQAFQKKLQTMSASGLPGDKIKLYLQNWQIQAQDLPEPLKQSLTEALAIYDQCPRILDLLGLLSTACSAIDPTDIEQDIKQIQELFLPRLQQQETRLKQEILQIYQQGLADTKWHFLPFVLDADVLGPKTLKVRGSQISDPEPPIRQTPLSLPPLHWWSWNPISLILNRRYLRVLRQAEARFGSLDHFFEQFSELSRSLVFNYMVNLVRASSTSPLNPQTVESWKKAFDQLFSSDYTQLDSIEAEAGYLSGQYIHTVDRALDLLVAAANGLEQNRI